MIENLIRRNRSCRRFYEKQRLQMAELKDLVNLGRLSASAANLQPLKYVLSLDPQKNEEIFKCLGWAAYFKDWPGPEKGERPSAYIIIVGDGDITKDVGCDHGIAAQSILLGAREMGFAGCMIGSLNRRKLKKYLDLSTRYGILLVIAIGKPKENVVIENMDSDGSVRYWRCEKGNHHVPKRALDNIILHCFD